MDPTDPSSPQITTPGDPPRAPEPGEAIALPVGRLVLAPVMVASATVVVAAVTMAPPLGGLPMAFSAWSGALAAAVGIIATLLAFRPNKPRPVELWPALLLGAQGASMLASLLLAWVLYSATQPQAVGFALALVVSYVGSWIAIAKVFASAAGGS